METASIDRRQAESARATISMMATRAAAFPLAVVVGILVARILGPTDRGIFSVLMLTGATILPVLQFGIPAGIRFHIANGNYQSKQVLVTATGIAVILGTLTLLVVALAWNSGWLGSVEEMPGWLVWPVLLSLPAQAVTLMLRQLMIGS